jgi:hypothetical protein
MAARSLAAGATQWARDATNVAEVTARVKDATGIRVDVLSPTQEAVYAYVAGSVRTPGRIVLDSGSNSFQLSWQEKGSATPKSIPGGPSATCAPPPTTSSRPSDYASARAAYQQRARAAIEQELGRLSPPLTLSRLRGLVARGAIGPELIALGEDGATVPLVVRGWLRDGSGSWTTDQKKYDEALNGHRTADRSFGIMTAPPPEQGGGADLPQRDHTGGFQGPDQRTPARHVRAESARGAGSRGAASR